MLFSELKCKDVINVKDCKKLGKVCDLEFDPCSGCICKIMVPGNNRILSFLNCEPNIVIPFKDICQIGQTSFWLTFAVEYVKFTIK